MSEIAVRDDNNSVAPVSGQPDNTPQFDPQASPLLLWAQEAQQANRIAHSLAQTSFVPASLRGKPQDITAAILAGQELGLRPMASLRSIDVIQGTPAMRAHAMRGLVQSHGHEIELVESTDERCVMRGRRKGGQKWQTVEWDMQRAARLGLTGKDQWKKQPKTMLIARATGEVCRLIASDVLHAMPYASEEIDGPWSGDEAAGPAVAPVTVAEVMHRPEPAPAVVEQPARSADAESDEGLWPEVAQPSGGDR